LELSQKKKAVPPKTTTMARANRRRRKFFIDAKVTKSGRMQNKKAPSRFFVMELLREV
jgi:hypothetical protein